MNIKALKHRFENLYEKSLRIDVGIKKHPIIMVESTKSIVGVNLEIDSSKILNKLSLCVNNFDCDLDTPNKIELKDIPEVISFVKLKQSLIDRDRDGIYENILNLSRVSDGKQILEFLLEFSLEYSNYYVHQFIWSVYRMELFLNNKYIKRSLIKCCERILQYDYINTQSSPFVKLDWPNIFSCVIIDFNMVSLYYAIINENLIRGKKISNLISSLEYFSTLINENRRYDIQFKEDQINKGRTWIFEYLLKNTMSIDYSFILNLNSCRSCLKIDGKLNVELIWTQLNNSIGNI